MQTGTHTARLLIKNTIISFCKISLSKISPMHSINQDIYSLLCSHYRDFVSHCTAIVLHAVLHMAWSTSHQNFLGLIYKLAIRHSIFNQTNLMLSWLLHFSLVTMVAITSLQSQELNRFVGTQNEGPILLHSIFSLVNWIPLLLSVIRKKSRRSGPSFYAMPDYSAHCNGFWDSSTEDLLVVQQRNTSSTKVTHNNIRVLLYPSGCSLLLLMCFSRPEALWTLMTETGGYWRFSKHLRKWAFATRFNGHFSCRLLQFYIL